MHTMTRYTLRPAAALLCAMLATGGAIAATADAGKSGGETVTISESSAWGDPAMAKIAVDSGRALMEHLDTARALLANGKVSQARSALLASREFADAIQRTMPYLRVVADMQDASKQVVQEDISTWAADLLPIYASLDELQVYAPEVARQTHGLVRQAQKHAAAGDRKRATKELRQAADDITRHTVYLPVDYVDEQVRGALYAINEKKPDLSAAKTAVNRALNSVTTVVDQVITRPG